MTYKDILNKNKYKYLITFITFSVLSFAYSKFTIDASTKSKVIIFVGAVILFTVVASISLLASTWAKKQITILRHNFKHFASNMKYRYTLLKSLNHILKHKYTEHSVEIVFAMFVHFYNTHFKDSPNWELDPVLFPKGKSELSDMYRWIKKIREDNYYELNSIEYSNNGFIYWGSQYQTFSYKIKNGELFIEPIEDKGMTEHSFELKKMRLTNELYELDSERVRWIIERRKYLMI